MKSKCGEKFYFVQGYESVFAGDPAVVDPTYRLPLRKIVLSTWLRDVMREKFDSDAEGRSIPRSFTASTPTRERPGPAS